MKKLFRTISKIGYGYAALFAAGPAMLGGSISAFAVHDFTLVGSEGYLTATAMGVGAIMTFATLVCLPQLRDVVDGIMGEQV